MALLLYALLHAVRIVFFLLSAHEGVCVCLHVEIISYKFD